MIVPANPMYGPFTPEEREGLDAVHSALLRAGLPNDRIHVERLRPYSEWHEGMVGIRITVHRAYRDTLTWEQWTAKLLLENAVDREYVWVRLALQAVTKLMEKHPDPDRVGLVPTPL